MDTMETEHVNEEIEWKQDGNNGNRACELWNKVETGWKRSVRKGGNMMDTMEAEHIYIMK